MWVIGCNIGTSDFGAVRWSISSISILIGERFGAKGNLPNHRVDRQSLGIYLDVPKVSKWVISYNLLTNGVNWGYNPVTSHLLTSWDIQVVGFWWFPPEWMFAVALFWPVEKAQESWVLPGEYVDERQHHGVNKSWKPWWLGLGFIFFCYCHPGTWRFPFLICFCSMMLKPQPFDDICLACCIFMYHWFFTSEESCRFLVGLKWVQIYLWEAALVLLLIHKNPVPCWGSFKYQGQFFFRDILWHQLAQEFLVNRYENWRSWNYKKTPAAFEIWYTCTYICTYTIHWYIPI